MATKPTFVFTWASDAVYSTGPAPLIGTATKINPGAALLAEGWKADDIPPAQFQNYILNDYSGWVVWQNGGSPLAGVNTHIVETDSLGETAVVDVTAGGNRQAPSSLGWYGNGQDGDVVVSTDITLSAEMFYNNLTVTGTGNIYTNGHRIYVKETLTIATGGVIQCDGEVGENGSAADVGNAPSEGGRGGGGVYESEVRTGALGRGGQGGRSTNADAGDPGRRAYEGIGGAGGSGGAGEVTLVGGGGGGVVPPGADSYTAVDLGSPPVGALQGRQSITSGITGFTHGGFTGRATPLTSGYFSEETPEGLLNGGGGGGGGGGSITPG